MIHIQDDDDILELGADEILTLSSGPSSPMQHETGAVEGLAALYAATLEIEAPPAPLEETPQQSDEATLSWVEKNFKFSLDTYLLKQVALKSFSHVLLTARSVALLAERDVIVWFENAQINQLKSSSENFRIRLDANVENAARSAMPSFHFCVIVPNGKLIVSDDRILTYDFIQRSFPYRDLGLEWARFTEQFNNITEARALRLSYKKVIEPKVSNCIVDLAKRQGLVENMLDPSALPDRQTTFALVTAPTWRSVLRKCKTCYPGRSHRWFPSQVLVDFNSTQNLYLALHSLYLQHRHAVVEPPASQSDGTAQRGRGGAINRRGPGRLRPSPPKRAKK